MYTIQVANEFGKAVVLYDNHVKVATVYSINSKVYSVEFHNSILCGSAVRQILDTIENFQRTIDESF